MRFWAVAILCTIPPFAIGTFYVYICIFVEVDHTYGIKYFNVLCTGVTIAIGLVVQFVYGRCCSSLRDDEDDDQVRLCKTSLACSLADLSDCAVGRRWARRARRG